MTQPDPDDPVTDGELDLADLDALGKLAAIPLVELESLDEILDDDDDDDDALVIASTTTLVMASSVLDQDATMAAFVTAYRSHTGDHPSSAQREAALLSFIARAGA